MVGVVAASMAPLIPCDRKVFVLCICSHVVSKITTQRGAGV